MFFWEEGGREETVAGFREASLANRRTGNPVLWQYWARVPSSHKKGNQRNWKCFVLLYNTLGEGEKEGERMRRFNSANGWLSIISKIVTGQFPSPQRLAWFSKLKVCEVASLLPSICGLRCLPKGRARHGIIKSLQPWTRFDI